jgi:hypothetical protein
MRLKELVRELADLIWQMEQQTQRTVEDTVLAYVRDAVTTEMEYRRRVQDLDRKLAELERISEAAATA